MMANVFAFAVRHYFTKTYAMNENSNESISCDRLDRLSPEELAYCRGTFRGNVFGVASDGPMARAFSPDSVEELQHFEAIMKEVDLQVGERRRKNYMHRACGATFQPDGAFTGSEQIEQRQWFYAARNSLRTAGLSPPETACFARLGLNESYSRYTNSRMTIVHNAWERAAVNLVADAVRKSGSSEVTSAFQQILRRWNKAVSMMSDEVEMDSFKCTVRHMVAVRRMGQLFRFRITNAPLKKDLPEKKRHYLGENWMINA